MASRPLIGFGIHELEQQFDQNRENADFLTKLLAELAHRKTQRAKNLQKRAVQARGILPRQEKKQTKAAPAETPRSARKPSEPPRAETRQKAAEPASAPVKPAMSSFSRASVNLGNLDEPERVLLTWTAFEVLSPQSFSKPQDLAAGEASRIARFDLHGLPWENGGEHARPKTRLFYQIVLGTVQMEPSVGALLSVYTDKREERPAARGESILATVIVDKAGCLVESEAVAVSSFAWGLPIALRGDLKGLGAWQGAEGKLLEGLDKKLRHVDEDGQPQPMTRTQLEEAYRWLVETLTLPEALVQPPSFAVRTYQYFKIEEPPEPLLLNSFFLGDLGRARELFRTKQATGNLKRYLGITKPRERRELLRDDKALADALRPTKTPLGRWPGKGRHPLVTLQQAAVNLAAHDLQEDGILAVNGPPGTGKTTLLRDVVAHVVTERAKAMTTFDDPEQAFKNTNLRIKRGNAFLWMYELDERLRGFEIVVASSNNKAVENVSAELPGIGAIADDAFANGYFKTVSDALLERDSWGVIAAVLGNAGNRHRFRQTFWWDDDTGLMRYLQHAAGTPARLSVKTPDGKTIERPPAIVTKENPPADKSQALRRWKAARRKFLEAEKQAKALVAEAERAARIIEEIPETEERRRDYFDKERQLQELQGPLEQVVGLLHQQLAEATQIRNQTQSASDELRAQKPGFLAFFFRRKYYRAWKDRYEIARQAALKAQRAHQDFARQHDDQQGKLTKLNSTLASWREAVEQIDRQLQELAAELRALRTKLGGTFIDEDFFASTHAPRQKASPWFDKASSRTRDNLFEAAIDLHKAFLDAAAKPMRHNLALLVDSFGTKSFGSAEKDAVIPHLWSSLFLVVPVVSTTFASVGRMFGRLGPETFGWLLIDEAGQALPQAAIGAIMRTKRAAVVGDPMQIEPVVVLPDQLTEAICREFRIDETRFNAPAASAQTLADLATAYFASFETKMGARDVGVPLLVHRRCADPMFSISNAVAYENLMVQAKAPKSSPILDLLGSSRWFDVAGGGQDKWCQQEGAVVLDLLQQLKKADVSPNIYIVTPFVVVQDRLRESIRNSRVLDGWVDSPYSWPFERVGTVHTVQGREAEAVILVLGAPLPGQTGARNWAGGRPNLLNVAVSRAQECLYVIGNKENWRRAGVFSELADRL